MSAAWGDAGLLIELLDRQVAYFESLRDEAQLRQLPQLLAFITSEPRLASILTDLRYEAREALASYRQADDEVRRELRTLWTANPAIRKRARKDAAPADLRRFPGKLRTRVPTLRHWLDGGLPKRARTTQWYLQRFRTWREDTRAPDEDYETALRLTQALDRIQQRFDYAAEQVGAAAETLAWPSLLRLSEAGEFLNTKPPFLSDDHVAYAKYYLAKQALPHRPRGSMYRRDLSRDELVRANHRLARVPADVKRLHEALRHRIGLGRSRRAIVERYAARCASFDADELRARSAARRGAPERELTLHFARYLFDQGLNPLLDPTISGLRPDIMHLAAGEPLYVEAKQYTSSPERTLRRAYDQVWSTWLNLRQQQPSVTEAFLVVFRRAGALVHLPETIRHEGLKLHSVLVDISQNRGSRETERGIHLTTADLLPTPANGS